MCMHLGSRDLLKFREMSANISETEQLDRHIQRNYKGRVIGNHKCPIECHDAIRYEMLF